MKKYIALMLACVMLFSTTLSVHATTIENDEWYDLIEEEIDTDIGGSIEVEPYGQYIMNVFTTLTQIDSGKIGIRADVKCSAVVSKIQVVFRLQKKSGSSWTTVGTNTLYDYNVSSTSKTVVGSGLSSGTYRAYAAAMVTDKNGYSETLTSYTGSITI